MTAAFNYHVDGKIASATHDGKSESFQWDGLALIHRGENRQVQSRCTDAVEVGLNAAEARYSTEFTSGDLFNNNLGKTKTLDYSKFNKGQIE